MLCIVSVYVVWALLTSWFVGFEKRGGEEPQPVRFGKSTGVLSREKARSNRFRRSASNIKRQR